MDKLLEEEFISTVLWEEKSLPKDAKSVMDILVLQTNFTPASLNKIYYFKSGPGGKKVKSGSIFQPAARRGGNAEWLFDNRNVQPKLLVDSRKQKKAQVQKGQGRKAGRAQKTQPRAQMSMAYKNNTSIITRICGRQILSVVARECKRLGIFTCGRQILYVALVKVNIRVEIEFLTSVVARECKRLRY
jgi:hypothetical protein